MLVGREIAEEESGGARARTQAALHSGTLHPRVADNNNNNVMNSKGYY